MPAGPIRAFINLKILAFFWLTAALLTVLANLNGALDIFLASLFYTEGQGWSAAGAAPWTWLYHWGPIPGIGLALFCFAGVIAGFFSPSWAKMRKPLLAVFLTIVVGSGLIVNGVLKPYWGRPRPNQAAEFGGLMDYRPPLSPGIPGAGHSFPSGHASIAFALMGLIALRKTRPRAAGLGVAGGIALGGLVGLARMVQGDHFFSDVVWSGNIMFLTSVSMDYLVSAPSLFRRWKNITRSKVCVFCAALILSAAASSLYYVLVHRAPYYESHSQGLGLGKQRGPVYIHLDEPYVDAQVIFTQDGRQGEQGRVHVTSWGLGERNAGVALKEYREVKDGALHVRCTIVRSGRFARLDHKVILALPPAMKGQFHIHFVQ